MNALHDKTQNQAKLCGWQARLNCGPPTFERTDPLRYGLCYARGVSVLILSDMPGHPPNRFAGAVRGRRSDGFRVCPAGFKMLPQGLRRFNLGVGIFQLITGIAICVITDLDAVVPWTSSIPLSWSRGNANFFVPSGTKVGSIAVGIYAGVTLLLSAVDHLVVVLPGVNGFYNRELAKNRNMFRWVEYSSKSFTAVWAAGPIVRRSGTAAGNCCCRRSHWRATSHLSPAPTEALRCPRCCANQTRPPQSSSRPTSTHHPATLILTNHVMLLPNTFNPIHTWQT